MHVSFSKTGKCQRRESWWPSCFLWFDLHCQVEWDIKVRWFCAKFPTNEHTVRRANSWTPRNYITQCRFLFRFRKSTHFKRKCITTLTFDLSTLFQGKEPISKLESFIKSNGLEIHELMASSEKKKEAQVESLLTWHTLLPNADILLIFWSQLWWKKQLRPSHSVCNWAKTVIVAAKLSNFMYRVKANDPRCPWVMLPGYC